MKKRLAAADSAWFAVDNPTNPMVVTGVIQLAGNLDLHEFQELVRTRMVGRYPEFSRIVQGRGFLAKWRKCVPDISQHVLAVPAGDLAAIVSDIMSQTLPIGRPPWLMQLINGLDGRTTIVARMHHGLADGLALAQVLLGLGEADQSTLATRRHFPGGGRVRTPGKFRLLGSMARLFFRLLTSLGEPRTVLTTTPGRRKITSWAPALKLAEVRAAAKSAGVTVNDILLSAVAGGLRELLGPDCAELRVLVPVDLRGGQPVKDLGNRLGLIFVKLPINLHSRHDRLHHIARQTTRLKASAEAGASFGILHLVGALPQIFGRLAVGILSRSASAVVTNVPGPREPFDLAGVPVEGVYFWVPQVGQISVGISIFSYAGMVGLGVSCDSSVDLSPDLLTSAISRELRCFIPPK